MQRRSSKLPVKGPAACSRNLRGGVGSCCGSPGFPRPGQHSLSLQSGQHGARRAKLIPDDREIEALLLGAPLPGRGKEKVLAGSYSPMPVLLIPFHHVIILATQSFSSPGWGEGCTKPSSRPLTTPLCQHCLSSVKCPIH